MDVNIQYGNKYIAIPPGETIKEQLKNRGLTQKEFAERMGYSEKHISRLINGYVELTPGLAVRLESVLGLSAKFWLNLEAEYRINLERVKYENEIQEDIALLRLFPYNEAAKNAWVKVTRNSEEKVIELRRFFEVALLKNINNLAIPGIAYRAVNKDEHNDYALAIWAQAARLQARKIDAPPINIKKLKEILGEIRALTVRPPEEFCDKLRELLLNCGIVLVFLPHLKGSFLHGASFVDSKHIVLGLTVRGKDADRFWFSLFHELGHILNGDIFNEKNKVDKNDQEKLADSFARDILIPQSELDIFCRNNNFTECGIRTFAYKVGIAPGIVVGRLQKEGYIKFNMFNNLKERYEIA